MGKPTICIGENKDADQLRGYREADLRLCFRLCKLLVSAFVFATRIVQSLYFLNTKFHASSCLLLLCSSVCVEPGRKPHCWFSHEAAPLLSNIQRPYCERAVHSKVYYCTSTKYEVIENKSEIIDKLENDIDRLEMFSKSDTMRVFGLPELIGENDETIRQHVVDSVLKVACPHTEWERDDIKRAYRVGIATDDQPPITIVRLRYDDYKPKVFRGRAKLRDHGIRVSNDLTVRQREELKRLKLNGQKGYFYQGQLVVQSADSENENTRGRVFRSASRRLDQRPNSESAPLGVNASPMEQEVYHSEHSIRLTQGLVTAQEQSHAADDLEPR